MGDQLRVAQRARWARPERVLVGEASQSESARQAVESGGWRAGGGWNWGKVIKRVGFLHVLRGELLSLQGIVATGSSLEPRHFPPTHPSTAHPLPSAALHTHFRTHTPQLGRALPANFPSSALGKPAAIVWRRQSTLSPSDRTSAEHQRTRSFVRSATGTVPSALVPQPSTLDPRPSTLDPRPSTLDLRSLDPSTQTPRPRPLVVPVRLARWTLRTDSPPLGSTDGCFRRGPLTSSRSRARRLPTRLAVSRLAAAPGTSTKTSPSMPPASLAIGMSQSPAAS